MLNRSELKQLVKLVVKSSIVGYVKAKNLKESNFQILDLLIPKERYIRSIVGGLETSVGTTLWQPLAKEVAKTNGFSVRSMKLEMPDPLPTNIATVIETVLEDRLGGHGQFDGLKTEKAIIDACQRFIRSPVTSFVSPPTGEGVDIWLERGGIDYLFDTKTVYPNVGSYSKFLGQVVKWKAYFYSRFPTSKCQANIVFPYNPYGKIDFWSKTMNCGRPLDKNYDALVEDEFWDL